MQNESARFCITFKSTYENEKILIEKLNSIPARTRAQYLANAVCFYEKFRDVGFVQDSERHTEILSESTIEDSVNSHVRMNSYNKNPDFDEDDTILYSIKDFVV